MSVTVRFDSFLSGVDVNVGVGGGGVGGRWLVSIMLYPIHSSIRNKMKISTILKFVVRSLLLLLFIVYELNYSGCYLYILVVVIVVVYSIFFSLACGKKGQSNNNNNNNKL